MALVPRIKMDFTPAQYYALLATDYLQTRTIAENPDKWHEQNAILGAHPTINKVNVYFAASAVISAMILNFAPPKIQRYFLNGASIVELGAVGNNITLGIKLSY